MGEIIVIIDGNSLINRAYYAMQRPMITKDGIYTQGIYGFVNMLNKLMSDYDPSYITVAFDMKAETFRLKEYGEYKAGRRSMPPELVMQMPLLKDVLHGMNIRTLELEGFEADDLMGTVAKEAERQGLKPLIITGDHDALQLASDRTRVLITKKGISEFDIYDDQKMKEVYNLTPDQFIDLKGLMGDKSDNIPGIPGVGEKTGIKLLEQFGSVENLVAHTDEIESEKLRAKVEENAQLALMSKRLSTIDTNVPIELDFDEFRRQEPDYDKLIDIYTRLEFNTFLKRIKTGKADAGEEPEQKQPLALKNAEERETFVASPEDSFAAVRGLNESDPVMVKVFGDFNHVSPPLIDGVFLADTQRAVYVPWTSDDSQVIIGILNEKNFKFYGHDIKNDIYSLMFYGLSRMEVWFDTAIAEYVLDVSRSEYELKTIALEKLHVDIDAAETAGDVGTKKDMYGGRIEKNLDYSLMIMNVILRLMEIQKEQLEEEGLEKVFYQAELPLVEVLAAMEKEGMKANGEFIDEFGKELKKQIEDLEQQIYDYAGEEFNINSPSQLGKVLFETLKLPSGKKTKRGYSTSAEVLEKIRPLHPIVDAVLTYRNLTKLNSTYVEGMKPLIGEDGKIRAHFQQTVTATGRISCTEPNLQNIPVRQETGRNLRKAFVASDDDHILVGADYSQIELRILAHLSEDPALVDAFNNGEDIHKLTASRVLGIPFDEITKEQRSRAKAVNFGVIYGMSSFGLSEELSISRKEAEEYINEYFRKHEKVKTYIDSQIENCRQLGYSETIMGRKRVIPEIKASQFTVRQLGERLATNSPIQGSAADIIKLAMIRVYRELKEKFPDSKLILQVHDELIINCRSEDIEKIREMLVRSMEGAMDLNVKLAVELNTGNSWYDLK